MNQDFTTGRQSASVTNDASTPSGDGGWQKKDNSLYRKFQFKDFSEAFAFMTRVAMIAKKMNHHPKWTNGWNTLEVLLYTHDAGNIVTDKDRKLAENINALL